jgi:hypothetical protein
MSVIDADDSSKMINFGQIHGLAEENTFESKNDAEQSFEDNKFSNDDTEFIKNLVKEFIMQDDSKV